MNRKISDGTFSLISPVNKSGCYYYRNPTSFLHIAAEVRIFRFLTHKLELRVSFLCEKDLQTMKLLLTHFLTFKN